MIVLKTFPHPVELRTRRLLLRAWKDSDLPAWCEMNADPQVRRHFPTVHTEAEALGEASRIRDALAQRGWGCWALEVPGVLPFAGFLESPPASAVMPTRRETATCRPISCTKRYVPWARRAALATFFRTAFPALAWPALTRIGVRPVTNIDRSLA